MDVNEYPPVFEETLYEVTIPESLGFGRVVLTVLAVDMDGSNQFSTISSYSIVEQNTIQNHRLPFSINANGSIVVSDFLDYDEGERNYVFEITAMDSGGLQSVPSTVRIHLTDINDSLPCPMISQYNISVFENYLPSIPLVNIEVPILATNNIITHQVSPSQSVIQVHSNGSVFLAQPLDYELQPELTLNIYHTSGYTLLFDTNHHCDKCQEYQR